MAKRIYKTVTDTLKKKIKSGKIEKKQLTGDALSYYNRIKAKRIYKTVTDTLKKKIKSGKVEKKQLTGDALSYYNRVKGAEKARLKKAEKIFRFGDAIIPRNSEIYSIVEKAAKIKGMSVREFVQAHQKAIERLMEDGDIITDRETSYAIKDISSISPGRSIYVNDLDGYVKKTRNETIFGIQQLYQYAVSYSDIFIIIFRLRYKLNGDIYMYLPDIEDYDGLEDAEMEDFLDDYYPHITYLVSAGNLKKNK